MTVIKDRKHKTELVLRLKRVEGQLRGIQAMIEAGADCEKVAQQLSASRRALDKAFFNVLACAIDTDPSAARLLTKFG
jgi:DNA-binding FrmR family transcriptional regulator